MNLKASVFVEMTILLLAMNKGYTCNEYKPSFRNELVQTEGEKLKEEKQPENFQKVLEIESLNYKISRSGYSYPDYFLKWTAFSRKQNKYDNSKIIQNLFTTIKVTKDIKMLSPVRRKRACVLQQVGRRKRGLRLQNECFNGIISGGGGSGGSGGDGGEGGLSSAATTESSSTPSTSKYPTTTINTPSESAPGTSSTLATTNNDIPLIPNEPIQTESSAKDFETTYNFDAVTTLSTFYSGLLTYLSTKSSTIVQPRATLRSTMSIPVSPSQSPKTQMFVQKQTSTPTPTYISITKSKSLKSSVSSLASSTLSLLSTQFESFKAKTTASTMTYLSTNQESLYQNPTNVLPEKTRISVQSTVQTSTDVTANTAGTSTETSILSIPFTTVLPVSASGKESRTAFTTAFFSLSSLPSKGESRFASDIASTDTVINLSYPAHQTFSTLSKDSNTQVHFGLATASSLSGKEEKLSQTASASLDTRQVTSDKASISDILAPSTTTAHDSSNNWPYKSSERFTDAGSSYFETVTVSTTTALSTTGHIILAGTLVSLEIQTQATSAAFNNTESDNTKPGFFQTASNIAIVSTVAATTALLSAVLLVYSYLSQTGGPGQLSNSVSYGDESQGNRYDRISPSSQDRASPSSTTNLISGSSPSLTPVEIYDVTGLDF